MRGRFFIFLILAGLAAYAFKPWQNVSPRSLPFTSESFARQQPAPQQVIVTVQVPVDRIIEVTRVVLVEQQILPTYTPYPTQTPYPTSTPVPINHIGAVGPGGQITQAFDVWGPRIFAFVFILIVIYGAYLIYQIEMEKVLAIRDVMEFQHEQELVRSMPAPRVIVSNRQLSDDTLSTPNGYRISKQKVVQFLLGVREVGLAISTWKTQMNWSQSDIEAVLDWLAILGMVTPRQNGVACTWTNDRWPRDILRIARMFGLRDTDLSVPINTETDQPHQQPHSQIDHNQEPLDLGEHVPQAAGY